MLFRGGKSFMFHTVYSTYIVDSQQEVFPSPYDGMLFLGELFDSVVVLEVVGTIHPGTDNPKFKCNAFMSRKHAKIAEFTRYVHYITFEQNYQYVGPSRTMEM